MKIFPVLDLSEIKMSSINKKFNFNFKTKRTFLNKSYTDFKKEVTNGCAKIPINPEKINTIHIQFHGYIDIDNPIKAILDSLADAYKFNDRDIINLTVKKIKIKRGQLGSLKVWLGYE